MRPLSLGVPSALRPAKNAAARPGSLGVTLASTQRASVRPIDRDHNLRRLVQDSVPTNVHRFGPLTAAGPMLTQQDVTRLRAPRVEDSAP